MAMSIIKMIDHIPALSVDVDTYTGHAAYIATSLASGTLPAGLGGNRYLMLNDIFRSGNKMMWGVQMAIGFQSSKIAIRNSGYGSGIWSEWRYI